MESRNMNVSKELTNEKIERTSGRTRRGEHAGCSQQISPMQRGHSRSTKELPQPIPALSFRERVQYRCTSIAQ